MYYYVRTHTTHIPTCYYSGLRISVSTPSKVQSLPSHQILNPLAFITPIKVKSLSREVFQLHSLDYWASRFNTTSRRQTGIRFSHPSKKGLHYQCIHSHMVAHRLHARAISVVRSTSRYVRIAKENTPSRTIAHTSTRLSFVSWPPLIRQRGNIRRW